MRCTRTLDGNCRVQIRGALHAFAVLNCGSPEGTGRADPVSAGDIACASAEACWGFISPRAVAQQTMHSFCVIQKLLIYLSEKVVLLKFTALPGHIAPPNHILTSCAIGVSPAKHRRLALLI